MRKAIRPIGGWLAGILVAALLMVALVNLGRWGSSAVTPTIETTWRGTLFALAVVYLTNKEGSLSHLRFFPLAVLISISSAAALCGKYSSPAFIRDALKRLDKAP